MRLMSSTYPLFPIPNRPKLQHNTAGINCEQCLTNYYRPRGMSQWRADACRPCDCDMSGSTSEECIKDELHAAGDGKLVRYIVIISISQEPGACRCKEGFGGRRCDRCALGYRNYPTCEPCPCNRHGSANFATCEEPCQCKVSI